MTGRRGRKGYLIRLALTATTLSATILVLGASSALARPGDLDATFSTDGIVRIGEDLGDRGARQGTDIALQADGKIVVVGNRRSGNIGVWRLNADGSPDFTFGGGDGRVGIDFEFRAGGEEVAISSDGRIVVVGTTVDASGRTHLALARLTPTGRLDPTFSGDGRVVRGGTNETRGLGVALDGAGNIYIAGDRSLDRFTVFKYTAAGAVDRSFGATGATVIRTFTGGVFSNFPLPNDLVLQPDGRILALGMHIDPDGSADCGVARLTPSGEPDASFSGDGVALAGFSEVQGGAACPGIALSSTNGKITVAGSFGAGSMALARFTSGGSLDANFDGDGRVTSTLDTPFTRAWGVGLEGTKTIAIGEAEVESDQGFNSVWAIARFTASGQLDSTSFGDGGRVFTNLTSGCCPIEAATSVAVAGEKLTIGGMIGVGGSIAVARYLAGSV